MLFAYLDENCNVRLVHIYREVWEFFEDNVTQLGAYLGRFVREFLVGALGFDLKSLRVLKCVGEIVERVASSGMNNANEEGSAVTGGAGEFIGGDGDS